MLIFGPMESVNTLEKLKKFLSRTDLDLNAEQNRWFERSAGAEGFLPFRATESFLQTALNAGEIDADALLRQVIPDEREFVVKEYELDDPLGEEMFSPLPRLVHRYPDRVLILVTDQCAMFCRHCFRRSFSGGESGAVSNERLIEIIAYISEHLELSEVLLSGGDPLTLSGKRITDIISRD